MQSAAAGRRIRASNANDLAPPEPAQLPVAVGSRGLTQHVPGQLSTPGASHNHGKAQSALPSSQSGAAAAEYSSRIFRFFAPAKSTANLWSARLSKQGAGSAVESLDNHQPRVNPRARPNPSLKLTRYGRLCKPGLRYSVHLLSPGLQSLMVRCANAHLLGGRFSAPFLSHIRIALGATQLCSAGLARFAASRTNLAATRLARSCALQLLPGEECLREARVQSSRPRGFGAS